MKSNMENNQRDFKWIWIPKEIWLNEDLSVMEKVLLVEITSLDWENGCFASNAYFAEFFGIIERNVIKHISQLKEKGLIYQESFDWRQRVLRSKVNSAMSKSTGLTSRKEQVSPVEIDTHNNTYSNTDTSSVSKDTSEVSVLGMKKISRVNKKKEFIKMPLPTKDEFFSFMWVSKGKEKFYEVLTTVNLQENFSLQELKALYDWMISFFKEKHDWKIYMDKDGNFVWWKIIIDVLDDMISYALQNQEEYIVKSLKWKLITFIKNSAKEKPFKK